MEPLKQRIAERLMTVRDRIRQAALSNQRDPSQIKLLAASKNTRPEVIIEAMICGQTCFGENYVQEAVRKIENVFSLLEQRKLKLYPEWHFIGPIQSNKTHLIAQYFDWVHSIDRMKIADRLSKSRDGNENPLNVCIQVNTSGEATKHGTRPNNVLMLAGHIKSLPNMRLRGLMSIPSKTTSKDVLRKEFKVLFDLNKLVRKDLDNIDTLSMGMSDDLELAIDEGSTVVRVGTALFGIRK